MKFNIFLDNENVAAGVSLRRVKTWLNLIKEAHREITHSTDCLLERQGSARLFFGLDGEQHKLEVVDASKYDARLKNAIAVKIGRLTA